MVRPYVTAAAVNENDLVTEVTDGRDIALQLNNAPLALSFFGQGLTNLLK